MQIGSEVEKNEWRQGTVLSGELSESLGARQGALFIVASQSCDLAQPCPIKEPHFEVVLAEPTNDPDPSKLNGRNPRELHIQIHFGDGSTAYYSTSALSKRKFDRHHLVTNKASTDYYLLEADVGVLSSWLAARYNRPALPDGFNQLVSSRRPRRIINSLNSEVSGVYVQLSPNRELEVGELYMVNLLCLVPSNKSDRLDDVREKLTALVECLSGLGMDVNGVADLETRVAVATLRPYVVLYLEYLSVAEPEALSPVRL